MPSRSAHAIPTELSELESATHGRERRHERNIQKIDLQRARRYGMKEPARSGREKFTYGGVVFIYDPFKNREVTSFESKDASSVKSGTKCAEPVLLPKAYEDDEDLLEEMLWRHDDARDRLLCNPSSWTSHSVLVVDMSGSMRRDDVSGARCRSDGVWLVLARDFLKRQLVEKQATIQDMVSIIVMKDSSKLYLACEPTDWVLYNKLVELREWETLRPKGAGNYMPALELAEQALALNPRSSCSLSLMFFSDGRPSDRGPFADRMGKIASTYGRRLTVCCIGMAEDEREDFRTLNDMVTEAEAYGAIASFNKPSMHADSLSNIITSLVTSVTGTKTEMTDIKTGKNKMVRTDVLRERRGTPDDQRLTNQWIAFRNSDHEHYVRRIWSWSYQRNDFIALRDPRCIFCYRTVDHLNPGGECSNCRACSICQDCIQANLLTKYHYKKKECYNFLTEMRSGNVIRKDITSFSVAMKKPIFGEGAERMVHKFRYLDDHDRFIGPKMVAKQSRFVELVDSYEERMDYHREFLRTQAISARMAHWFNEEIDGLLKHTNERDHWRVHAMPRIKFLEPYVVEVVQQDGTELNILIEPQLGGKYEKFNNNMGYVKDGINSSVKNGMGDLIKSFNHLGLDLEGDAGGGEDGLGAIEEETEEEEESDDEEAIPVVQEPSVPDDSEVYKDLHERHFPQAFSHYTFEKSKRNLMVVDLQGVLEEKVDGTRQYVLTDPVIHTRKHKRRTKQKFATFTFGRTDRHEKGMRAFFETHVCSDVCRILGLKDSSSWSWSARSE